MVVGAAGAAQTPKIDGFRPAQNPEDKKNVAEQRQVHPAEGVWRGRPRLQGFWGWLRD